MNVKRDVISQLMENGLINHEVRPSDLPPERRRNEIANFEPIVINSIKDDRPSHGVSLLDALESNIYIPDGDMPFPEDLDLRRLSGRYREWDGIETLAWYRPYHYYRDWGICILDTGIYFIAKRILDCTPSEEFADRGLNLLSLLRLGFRFLLMHEFFHFMTETACSTIEISHAMNKRSFYRQYQEEIYLKPYGENDPLEEALANAFGLKRMVRSGVYQELKTILKAGPRGYRDFDKYLSKENNAHGIRELMALVHMGKRIPQKLGPSSSITMPPMELLFDYSFHDYSIGDVPIYLYPTIRAPRYSMRVMFQQNVLGVIETNSFSKKMKKGIGDKQEKAWKKSKRFLRQNLIENARLKPISGRDTLYAAKADGHRAIITVVESKKIPNSIYFGAFDICSHDNYENYYKKKKLDSNRLQMIRNEVLDKARE